MPIAPIALLPLVEDDAIYHDAPQSDTHPRRSSLAGCAGQAQAYHFGRGCGTSGCPWDRAPTLFANAADDFVQTVRASVPSVTSVVYSSNSRCPRAADGKSDIRIVTAARKPWRTRYLHDESGPVAVAGDQVLTDGLLAWRLGASFLHWQVAGSMPRWPRLQRWIGRIAAPFLFKDDDGSST